MSSGSFSGPKKGKMSFLLTLDLWCPGMHFQCLGHSWFRSNSQGEFGIRGERRGRISMGSNFVC